MGPLPFPRIVTLTFLFWLALILLLTCIFHDPLGNADIPVLVAFAL